MSNLAADLKKLAPSASSAIIAGIVANAHFLDEAGINTPIRLRHFFARVCVETGGLRFLSENLNYSAKRLCEVWPKRFPTLASAQPYANNPRKLANKVYGGRLGNSAKNDDGYNYRGSGALQNTGKVNFELVEKETGLPVVENPDLLRKFPTALQAATLFWTKHNINKFSDKDDEDGVCHAINGGENGLAEQRAYLHVAAKVWPDVVQKPVAIATLTTKQVNSIMHLGSKGDFVKTLQENLNTLGYPHLDPDGVFGEDTDANVRTFQKDAKLEKVDGWAGPATVTAIAKELEKRKTAPKIEAAGKVVDNAAGSESLGGFSKTEVVAAIAGTTGTANAVKEGVDAVNSTTSSFMDLATTVGPWVLLALVLAGGAAFIIWDRRRKRIEAQAVQKVM